MNMKTLFFILKKLCIRPIIFVSFWILIKPQISFGQYSCGDHKVYVCHKGKNTLCIDESAVQAHLDHGDYLGPCDSNECSVSASGGKITCKDTIATLIAISSTTEVTYSWSGPNDFTSSLESPSVNIPGTYTVTITDSANGCSATASIVVTQDTLKPGAIASSEVITCDNTSATLSGSSGTSGVTFKWTGPEDYISTQQNTGSSIPGEYILLVINPLNSCMSVDTTIVQQNNAVPDNILASVEDTLTCTNTSVALTGTSSTSNVSYKWFGPNGYNSTEQYPVVSNPGIYLLIVKDTINGCSSWTSTSVEKNASIPRSVSAIASGKLTCTDSTVILKGSSSSTGVTYSWLDPNSFIFTGDSVIISIPGTYTFKVTNTVSGCSESVSVTIEKNITVPEGLTVTVSDTLNCLIKNVILSASSSTNGVLYSWTGPANFKSNKQNEKTSLPGNYKVTAMNPVNGCTSEKQITVIEEECVEP